MPSPSNSEVVDQGPNRSTEVLGGLTTAFAVASDQTHALYDVWLKTWMQQGQNFLRTLEGDGAVALEGVQDCRSPLDLFKVEQTWLLALSNAYVDAGLHLLSVNLHEAEAAAAASTRQGFRLPD